MSKWLKAIQEPSPKTELLTHRISNVLGLIMAVAVPLFFFKVSFGLFDSAYEGDSVVENLAAFKQLLENGQFVISGAITFFLAGMAGTGGIIYILMRIFGFHIGIAMKKEKFWHVDSQKEDTTWLT